MPERKFPESRERYRSASLISFDAAPSGRPLINIALSISRLYRSAALNHANQNHDDRHNQQDVDESTHGERRNQAQQPKNEQNNRKRPEQIHDRLLFLFREIGSRNHAGVICDLYDREKVK